MESMRNGGLARLRLVLVLTIGVAVAAALVAAGAGQAQEETSASEDSSVGAQSVIPDDPDGEPRRHLVPTEDGVKIKPILSTGDIVVDPEGARNEYQMSGIPDGLGAYKSDKGMLKVLINHELDGTRPDSPEGVGARVSWLSLDPETLSVKSASYPITGREGFVRFCSATLSYIDGKPLYFTGEESTDEGSLTNDTTDGLGRGGSSIVLNTKSGEYSETRHFGLLPHENIVPVKGLARATVLTTEDGDPSVNESQLYSYIAPTFGDAISGDRGSLSVWKANADPDTDEDPSTNDIEQGETIRGQFVSISQDDNTDADTLEAAAQSKDAFDFVRLEDAAVSKTTNNVLYIADTGSLGSESNQGRLYRFKIDKDHPRKASLTLLIDGDASSDPVQMTNPDNMDTSEDSVVIQEDRNSEWRQPDDPGNGYGRVLVYDLESKELRAVARVNTPPALQPPLEPGTWESSGVINASRLLGEDQWLLDVQAHSLPEEQPGLNLVPDSSVGEDGQLLRIKIPNS